MKNDWSWLGDVWTEKCLKLIFIVEFKKPNLQNHRKIVHALLGFVKQNRRNSLTWCCRQLKVKKITSTKTEKYCVLKGALSRILTDFRRFKIYISGVGNLKIMASFINNCYVWALKLLTSIFGCGWLEWKWIATWKIQAKLYKLFPSVVKKKSIFIALVWFLSANQGDVFL